LEVNEAIAGEESCPKDQLVFLIFLEIDLKGILISNIINPEDHSSICEIMEKRCLVCETVFTDYLYNKTLARCSSCGFITANMEVDQETLRKIYSVNYFNGEEYSDYKLDKQVLVENFRRRIRSIVKLVDPSGIKNMIEIGCAYGFFGEEMVRRFPGATYTGFDIAEDACMYAREELHLDARCEDFLDTEPGKTFTDAFMWDSIEHLSRPDLYIEKIGSLLEENGRIYITTGDIGALVPRVMKANWRLIHPPSHLHYFSKASLSQLLNKNGFSVQTISYPGNSRSMKQIFYSLFLLQKKGNSLSRLLYSLIPERWQITINTRDIMFVIAVKD
jgi:SAM-dependent methyltransferase